MKHLINKSYYFIITVVLIIVVFLNTSVTDSAVSNNTDALSLIIIDAGHGGKDGGAVANDGTQEQYINLAIALEMNEYLTNKGFRTLLVRDDDNSVHDSDAQTIREQKVSDIRNRLKISEEYDNSIFVSVHQNMFTESKYHGTQVFYSPNNPESEVLASFIQKSVVKQLQPDNTRQIKKCDKSVYLMYNTNAIAVLAECGFLSNPDELEKLKDENYQRRIAESICNGIIDYINNTQECSTSEY
ncbi:MAG: N-acetylmuramoyl-L-alanine amidase [Clostridia bacterium]|nr:N-acetylmuramoyl-L-alanine amidase [Clostridia bacterium]